MSETSVMGSFLPLVWHRMLGAVSTLRGISTIQQREMSSYSSHRQQPPLFSCLARYKA